MARATDNGALARQLMRQQTHAALATCLADGDAGHPYASLVAVAFDLDASPLLLLSDLARHTRNVASDARVSLLFAAKGEDHLRPTEDPLDAPRLSLLGTAARADDPALLARFLSRHPSAAVYAGFGDFHLYRVTIDRGHLIAGFGRIRWIEAAELRLGVAAEALAAAEPGILAHMNADHADAVALFATGLLGGAAGPWRMTGIDPEGVDLGRDGETARLDFAEYAMEPVLDAAAARRALVALTRHARDRPTG